MSGRNPDQIWDKSVDEGRRRLDRKIVGLLATGSMGGVDVMLGIMALTVVSGALAVVLPDPVAHVGGSLVFGIGFVLLLIGRSELFTENFLVPVGAVVRGHSSVRQLLRLWGVTMLANVAALLLLSLILTRAGLVPPETLKAAGKISDTFAARDLFSAFLSAVLAGTAMTLLTWNVQAVTSDAARIALALLVGFLLAAPSLNHAIVSVGEMAFGIMSGKAQHAGWINLLQNFPIAVAGNLVGGLGFVTLTRALQVHGDPESEGAGDGEERLPAKRPATPAPRGVEAPSYS
jgi:formate/nitrite transporter FocA (FNT family)